VLNQAISGTVPNDLSALVAGIGKVTAALNVHEQQLGELIVNFNAFFRSFADQATSLQTTVGELPSSLAAINRGFTELGAAFPPARTFAHDIIPGSRPRPRRSRPRCPGSNRCRRRWRRPSSAASPKGWPRRLRG
jgi:hypothetical protein